MSRMRKLILLIFCMMPLALTGCYEETVKEAASKLKIGMSKSELDHILKEVKFLKEQSVLMYPNSTVEEMRGSLIGNKTYEYRHPENIIDLLTFDGNVKVYSYLIRRERIYANPTSVDYLAVFYDQKENKLMGWAHIRTSGDVDTWRDKF